MADASAIGLLAQVDSSFDQKSDQWVRVTGKLGVTTFAGEKVPVILPDKIEPIPRPTSRIFIHKRFNLGGPAKPHLSRISWANPRS